MNRAGPHKTPKLICRFHEAEASAYAADQKPEFAFLSQAPATAPEAEGLVVIQEDRPAVARGI